MSAAGSTMFCGIDPGRFKIGVAFADGSRLLFSAIVPKADEDTLCGALRSGVWGALDAWRREGSVSDIEGRALDGIYIGDGTSSGELRGKLADLNPEIVNEYGTTLVGRALYWKLHPPAGLWRLVPVSLRTPPRDIDDLAAFCIITRR